jgi:hypothetical protein
MQNFCIKRSQKLIDVDFDEFKLVMFPSSLVFMFCGIVSKKLANNHHKMFYKSTLILLIVLLMTLSKLGVGKVSSCCLGFSKVKVILNVELCVKSKWKAYDVGWFPTSLLNHTKCDWWMLIIKLITIFPKLKDKVLLNKIGRNVGIIDMEKDLVL